MRQLPEHGPCFVCGTENPHGIGVQWYVQENGGIYGEVTLSESQQGPPGLAHGGASAALLDEAMGAAIWQAGHMVAAVNLSIDFRQPVPLGVKIKISANVVGKNNRKVHARGEICLPDGEIAVVGQGIFVEARHLFANLSPADRE